MFVSKRNNNNNNKSNGRNKQNSHTVVSTPTKFETRNAKNKKNITLRTKMILCIFIL